ncbi:MAG: heavy metal resistance protein CzcB [Planctomycetaceae bacterium]|nr:heavy metal resistance protein CzcB [Planctomycetaceae bacterium]
MKLNQELVQSAIRGGRYLGILSLLVTFGYFGHQTHWTFAAESHGSAAHAPDHSPVPVEEPVTRGTTVEFPTPQSVIKSGITTAKSEQRALHERVKATGVLAYDQRLTAQLSSRASGTVWKSVKNAGDTVQKGDVIIVIDAAEVGRVKTEFLSALVAVESKTEILANMEKNKAIGVTPHQQVREARIALRETKIQLLNAEQKLINFGFCVRASEFSELDDAARSEKIHFLGLTPEIIAELDPNRTSSNLLPLTAPFDGELIGHEAVRGESVEAGKPILEVANVDRMWIKLNVPKEDGMKLVLGQTVAFNPDGLEEDFQSHISWISTAVDEQTRTLQVRAEVDNPVVSADPKTGRRVHQLRANAFGTATILVRESPKAVSVPISAIIQTENGPLLFVQTGERSFRRCEVKVGIRDGEFIEILSGGVKPGQQVVTQGNHVLKSEITLNQLAASDSKGG